MLCVPRYRMMMEVVVCVADMAVVIRLDGVLPT